MPATLSFNGVSFDPETGELGGAITGYCRLPKYVAVVMETLMRARGRVVTQDALVDAMWRGRDDGPLSKQLHVAIHRLRRELLRVKAPAFVMNAWGAGYRLDVHCPTCGHTAGGTP